MPVFVPHDRQPTPDERTGMDWWNSLGQIERDYWLKRVGNINASAADAWALFKRGHRLS